VRLCALGRSTSVIGCLTETFFRSTTRGFFFGIFLASTFYRELQYGAVSPSSRATERAARSPTCRAAPAESMTGSFSGVGQPAPPPDATPPSETLPPGLPRSSSPPSVGRPLDQVGRDVSRSMRRRICSNRGRVKWLSANWRTKDRTCGRGARHHWASALRLFPAPFAVVAKPAPPSHSDPRCSCRSVRAFLAGSPLPQRSRLRYSGAPLGTPCRRSQRQAAIAY